MPVLIFIEVSAPIHALWRDGAHMKRLIMTAGLLLVSACFDNPTETMGGRGAPEFAASAAGIQAVFLGGNPSRAYGINEAGFTVGSVDGNGIATVWTAPGTFSVVGPGLFSQFHDVNDAGVAVGYWAVEGGTIHAVSWTQAGGFQDIGTLRAGSYSYAHAINNSGQIVGQDQQGGQRPFLWSPSAGMTALPILAGSMNGIAFDINDAGVVVGESHAELDGINHGVLWPTSGGVVDLGSLGGRFSTARGINSSGQVVGWSMVANEELHAFIWTAATGMVDLNTWGSPCAGASQAEAISDAGLVVGACEGRPVIWSQTQGMRELRTPDGGSQGSAHDINSQGHVVGTFGNIGAALWIVEQTPPVIDPGPANMLRTALWNGEARGINRDRAVVGFGGFPGAVGAGALVWWPGLVNPLELPVLPGDAIGVAIAINDAWQIVGSSGSRAVLWQPNASRTAWTVHDLGAAGGSVAQAMNNAGLIVGTAGNNGFVWVPNTRNGTVGTIKSVCAAPAGFQCLSSGAYGINDAGTIAGRGTYTRDTTGFRDAPVVWNPPDWTSGRMLPYMDPADRQSNQVSGIDEAGNVVGSTVLFDATAVPTQGFTFHCVGRDLPPGTQTCAVAMMWPADGGPPVDLGTLGGANLNQAMAVELVGAGREVQIAGVGSDATRFQFALRWTAATGMQKLPVPSSASQGGGLAYGINTRGDIVGSDGSSATVWHADPLEAVPAVQTITFTSAPPNPAKVGLSYTLSATGGGSGNPVLFATASAACAVEGSLVSLVAVGTCTVTANQVGSASYAAAATVDQIFEVVAGDQTITFTTNPPNPAFVGNSYAVAATGGGSGNLVEFSSTDDAVCSVSGSAVTLNAVGTCQLIASQAGNADYNDAAPVTQDFLIVKRPQTIAFTSLPPAPALLDGSYTVAATGGGSGNPVSFSSLTPTVCTAAGSTVVFIQVGACKLAADQAGNNGYLPAAQQEQQVNVIYKFSGFFTPVDNIPVVNRTNAGKGISVEFDLAGNRGLDVLEAGSPTSGSYACSASSEDLVEVTLTISKSSLSYKSTTGRYEYAWRTEKTWVNTCRKLIIKLRDGTVHEALFHFVK